MGVLKKRFDRQWLVILQWRHFRNIYILRRPSVTVMSHPSYALVQSNPWWAPKPKIGRVAVIRTHDHSTSFWTLIARPRSYQVLACIHPERHKDPRHYLGVGHWYTQPDQAGDGALVDSCVIHRIAQAHYAWGLSELHDYRNGVRNVLLGKNGPRLRRHALESSPFQPSGPWTWVPPDAPFDYRVRAKCSFPKTSTTKGSIEDVALRISRRLYQPLLLQSRPFDPWR
jgi:hypothetical protein